MPPAGHNHRGHCFVDREFPRSWRSRCPAERQTHHNAVQHCRMMFGGNHVDCVTTRDIRLYTGTGPSVVGDIADRDEPD